MDELRLVGKPASAGYAVGPVEVLPDAVMDARSAGDRKTETDALSSAIVAAVEELSQLAAQADSSGAEILAFQIAMLEDETFSRACLRRHRAGLSADQAWRRALDGQISDYESAADPYFRARASDLSDIRDRVLATINGIQLEATTPEGAILVGKDLTPSRFLTTDWSRGGALL